MDRLVASLLHFQNEVFPRDRQRYERLAKGQSPDTLFIGCSDSRILPNDMLQAGAGELFICRNAGNIVPPHGDVLGGVSATVEYAVQVLRVKHIIVCGHSDCGAMRALLHPEKVMQFRAVAQWLRHADRASAVAKELDGDLPEEEFLKRLIEENVVAQLDNLSTHPWVAAKVRAGILTLHGMVVDIATGSFSVLDRQAQRFYPLSAATKEQIAAFVGRSQMAVPEEVDA